MFIGWFGSYLNILTIVLFGTWTIWPLFGLLPEQSNCCWVWYLNNLTVVWFGTWTIFPLFGLVPERYDRCLGLVPSTLITFCLGWYPIIRSLVWFGTRASCPLVWFGTWTARVGTHSPSALSTNLMTSLLQKKRNRIMCVKDICALFQCCQDPNTQKSAAVTTM